MTRQQLAAQLAKELSRGDSLHRREGTTVWCTLHGEWGAYAGFQKPHADAAFYQVIGWPQELIATRVKVEKKLKQLEQEKAGSARYITHTTKDRRRTENREKA